jgi:hypothetical protein
VTDMLQLPPRSLLTFIDETGNEDLSDPKNPTFGRGGCGALFTEIQATNCQAMAATETAKTWRRHQAVSRYRFRTNTPDDASDRRHQRLSGASILAPRNHVRFQNGVTRRHRCSQGHLPGRDELFARLVSRMDVVALIFEQCDRGDTLVHRDHDLASMDLKNVRGHRVEVEGCFILKSSMESGLEVALSKLLKA